MPAQALRAFERDGGLTPGVSSTHFAETFPSMVRHLGRHFGVGPLLLWITGIVAALRYRQGAVLYLCLPAIAINALFFGGYYTVFSRYLFVIDLFALPVAGVGAAALLQLALAAIRSLRVP